MLLCFWDTLTGEWSEILDSRSKLKPALVSESVLFVSIDNISRLFCAIANLTSKVGFLLSRSSILCQNCPETNVSHS